SPRIRPRPWDETWDESPFLLPDTPGSTRALTCRPCATFRAALWKVVIRPWRPRQAVTEGPGSLAWRQGSGGRPVGTADARACGGLGPLTSDGAVACRVSPCRGDAAQAYPGWDRYRERSGRTQVFGN